MRASRPHGCQQWLDADDVQHTRKIVAEYVQRHFGRYIGQSLHQKVRRTHPHLQCGERMLDGFAAHTHGLRVLIEPRLRGPGRMTETRQITPYLRRKGDGSLRMCGAFAAVRGCVAVVSIAPMPGVGGST